jgi:putative F0F1-ATPase subunit (Ca2+/Mg2+ transporter)
VELHERRDMYNGFGDGLARAFELALTPAVFGGLGYLLDGELGLAPLLTIVLFLFGVAGTSYMAWFRYDAEMRQLEAGKPWARRRPDEEER